MPPGAGSPGREVAMSLRTRQILRLAPVLLAMPVLAGGCASIFHGTRQKVEVFTDPPGATATSGDQQVTTPGVLKLPRKVRNTEIRIEKEGFAAKTVVLQRRTSGLVWLNLIGVPAGALAGGVGGATSSGDDWVALGNAAKGALAGSALVPTAGFATDFANGAAYRLDPARVVVRLEPVAGSSASKEDHE
jgi:hypothetical protein